MTPEIAAALALLKNLQPDAADISELARELRGSPIYQSAYNAGHADATHTLKPKSKEAADKLKDSEARIAELDAEIGELKNKMPDLAARDDAWRKKLDAAKAEVEHEKRLRAEARESVKAERLASELKSHLRPKYAQLIAPILAQRIREKEDGAFEFLEEGTGIPVQVPAGKSVFQAAAEWAKKDADPVDVLSNAESGGGVDNRISNSAAHGAAPDVVERFAERTRINRANRPNALLGVRSPISIPAGSAKIPTR